MATDSDTRSDSVGQAHTPLPVAYLYESDDGSKDLVLDPNGEYARRLLELGRTETPLYAHPPSIHAVNCHDELLAALEAIIADCGEVMMDGYVENSIHSREVALAKAAIAKAKGGQP